MHSRTGISLYYQSLMFVSSESTSIPTNPRSGRAVGYAFVDLTTKEEAERAIAELSGKEVLERKVSVQLARKPGTASAKRESHYNTTAPMEGQQEQQEDGEQEQRQGGGRRNGGDRGRGRRRGRGGRVSTHFPSSFYPVLLI